MRAIRRRLAGMACRCLIPAGLLVHAARSDAQKPLHWEQVSVSYELSIGQIRPVGRFVLGCGGLDPLTGRTVLVDRDSLVAVEIAPSGTVVGRTGLWGKGQGQIESCVFMGWLGRRLWVSDLRLSRVTLFGSGLTNGVSQLVAIPAERAGAAAYVSALVGLAEVILEFSEPRDSLRTKVLAMPVVRYSLDSRAEADTLTTLTVRHRNLMLSWEDRTAYIGLQPWSDDPLLKVGPRSDLIVRVDRRAATRTGPFLLTVTVLDTKGHRLVTWPYRYTPQPLKDAAISGVLGAKVRLLSWHPQLRDSVAAVRWLEERVFRPRFLPRVNEVLVALDSAIWLRHVEGSAPTDSSMWTRHSLNGHSVQYMMLPATFHALGADGHTIAGVKMNDEWRVTSVVRYRF
jgi:hypothetical protein